MSCPRLCDERMLMWGEEEGITGTKGKIKQRHGSATLFSIFHAILPDSPVGPNERFPLIPRPKMPLTRISERHPLTWLSETIRRLSVSLFSNHFL